MARQPFFSLRIRRPPAVAEGEDGMGRNYGLTNTEMELMELLWQADAPLSFRELMDHANERWKKNWKKQTLNTYLANLQRMGLIGTDKGSRHYLYYARCTREELIRNWTRQMVEECFDNSISSLVAAFTGGKKLSEEEAEKLRQLIE